MSANKRHRPMSRAQLAAWVIQNTARQRGISEAEAVQWLEAQAANPPKFVSMTAEELGFDFQPLDPADFGFNFDILENDNDFNVLDCAKRARRSSRKAKGAAR